MPRIIKDTNMTRQSSQMYCRIFRRQEPLRDYPRRFKKAEEIFRSQMKGPLIIPVAVRNHPNWYAIDADEILKCQDEVYNR